MNDDPGEVPEARPSPGGSAGPPPSGPAVTSAGPAILRTSVAGTALFTVLAVGAVLTDVVVPVFVVVSLVLFAAGTIAFVVAFLRAVDRSRTETIGVGGLFFGAGATPGRVQAVLLGSLGVQVVVAITAAALRPYTGVAFGTLAPMWALGLAGLWVARHGVFPARAPELTRAGQRDAERAAHKRVGRPRPGGGGEGAGGGGEPPRGPGAGE
jgi:hypothetical protein